MVCNFVVSRSAYTLPMGFSKWLVDIISSGPGLPRNYSDLDNMFYSEVTLPF